ncbi:LPS assembly lipoprotein LptE [Terriglobus aquaticus]|uniref:LPS assembly lipoprotein LptE n=1 Tax=Terriglobus aquaticus TaxID=940139 RepID=A0ABW9KPC7_9BACT|nr:LPS assembly lipoprotein LptE [Terriglobus aquaticus]
MRLRAFAAVPGVFLLLLAGCGYHAAGNANHIPGNVRTLAVPVFATRAQQYRTEVVFTEAVIHELNTRTRYRIVNTSDADKSDAVLKGTILSENIAPLTYDAASGATSSYLVTVQAQMTLVGGDGHVLYSNDKFLFREQFQSTQDLSAFIQEDSPAVRRLARDFAQAAVSDLLNSF